MEIAIYGKGGIGKSTLSSNLSAAIASRGPRVLQIGCDPKHDSVRQLMRGAELETVLSYLRRTGPDSAEPAAVMGIGAFGVGCVEAGGPQPGVGCAGRGIISAFEFLARHRVKDDYDFVIYDVLGDVVCGGFAVPVRREYADAVLLVTSGEFMAIYAANNILRGIRSFDGETGARVAGILHNERGADDERGRVDRFAEAAGLPVLARVPRSAAFSEAERRKITLMEMGGGETADIFRRLADAVIAGPKLYPARPLEDDELERVVLGGGETPGSPEAGGAKVNASEPPARESGEAGPGAGIDAATDKNPPEARPPLYGCAFNGAAVMAASLSDAVVIAHSPRSCAFYTWQNISSSGRRNLFNRGILMPSALSPRFESTEMDDAQIVFGGMEAVTARVREAMRGRGGRRPGAVFVISSCVSGIIGDDIASLERLSEPDCPVIAIKADGDIRGDYMEGLRLCRFEAAKRLIDPSVKPAGRSVNIVGEMGVSNQLEWNHRVTKELLSLMEIGINCRFMAGSTSDEVRNFLRAPLCVRASDAADTRELAEWLAQKYGCRFAERAIPVGFRATREWIEELAAFFDGGDAGRAAPIIAEEGERYAERIAALRPALAGRRAIITTINADLDWVIEPAAEAGMEFVWAGVVNYLRTPVRITSRPELFGAIDEDLDGELFRRKTAECRPDIVLTNYTALAGEGPFVTDALPMVPAAGFRSGLILLERWARLFTTRRKGDWHKDEAVFEKYFA